MNRTRIVPLLAGLLAATIIGAAPSSEETGAPSTATATLECRIRQNLDLIFLSDFGEPPQMALWLEDPQSGATRTLHVTHRAASGDWKGKLECPAALPRWFEIYRREFGKSGTPRLKDPLPDGLSGATSKSEELVLTADVPGDRPWIVWLEVNIAADFNEHFPRPGEGQAIADTDFDGQPSILYRAELADASGALVVPELWAYTRPRTRRGEYERDLSVITAARDILPSIEMRWRAAATPPEQKPPPTPDSHPAKTGEQ